MAFPTDIDTGNNLTVTLGGGRPYLSSAGNVYVVGRSDTGDPLNKLRAFKATDPSSSFANVGTDVTVGSGASLDSIHAMATVQSGDNIHVAAINGNLGGGTTVSLTYHVFSMASDSWTTTNESVQASYSVASIPNTNDIACQIMLRSNGDVVVIYQGAKDAVMGSNWQRVDYARKVSGTWTVGVALDNAGETNWVVHGLVPGSSDRTHFFFGNGTAADNYQRALTSANALEAFPASYDGTPAITGRHSTLGGRSYDSAGTQKVRFAYADDTSNTLSVALLDSADTPTVTTATDITGAVAYFQGKYTADMAADGTDLYAVYSNDAATDTFRFVKNANDAGWGGDTQIVASAVATVFCSIFTRAGSKVIAIVYSNDTYTEYTLVAAAGSLVFNPFPLQHLLVR